MTLIYSADRERRLRLILKVGVVTGGLLALLAAYIFVAIDSGQRVDGVLAAATGAVTLLATGWALKLLPERDRRARTASVGAGVVLLLVGLLFAAYVFGFVVILLGVFTLLLALLRDDPEGIS